MQKNILKLAVIAGLFAAIGTIGKAQIVVTNMNNAVISNNNSFFTYNVATGAVSYGNGNPYALMFAHDGFFEGFGMVSTFNDTIFMPSADLLSSGASVAGATFNFNTFFGEFSQIQSVDRGYLGLRFDATSGATDDAYYGWVNFSFNAATGFVLHQFAMQMQPGADILAGQVSAVPEPATVAALMGGCAGLAAMAFRRRKAA